MKLFGITLGMLGATAVPALAQDATASGGFFGGIGDLLGDLLNPLFPNHPPASSVPEIDASSGLLAIAAVLAALAFAWERKRRA